MNRAGKKAWLRELKRRQKAARGAGSEAAAGTVPAVGDCPRPESAGEDAAAADASEAQAARGAQNTGGTVLDLTTGTVPNPPSPRLRRAGVGDSPLESEVVIAEAELQAARGYASESRELPDDEARAMLIEAARLLHSVVRNANRVLDSLPPQRVLEAVCEPASSAAQGSPQSRPRRGSDPVFTLMRLGKEAASLLKRVLAKTNPGLGRVTKVA